MNTLIHKLMKYIQHHLIYVRNSLVGEMQYAYIQTLLGFKLLK